MKTSNSSQNQQKQDSTCSEDKTQKGNMPPDKQKEQQKKQDPKEQPKKPS